MRYFRILLYMIGVTMGLNGEHNLSHEQREESFQVSMQKLSDQIKTRSDLPHVSVRKQLELLDLLSQFDLGRFLIARGGLNGQWTHYVITHPLQKHKTFNSLETFLLNRAPTVLATQQRFTIFKKEIQKKVKEGCVFASIPSGLMADLLDLDYSQISHFKLYGIDIDRESLDRAADFAKEKGLFKQCIFSCKDAWNLNMDQKFDLITSNGLTIYEADDERVIELYRQFYQALKPGGCLVTSFLTLPPIPGERTEWNLQKVNPEDALLQKIIFSDILACKWQVFRSEQQVKNQLEAAGFSEIEVIYDDAHIFPTIVARK